MTPVSFAKLKAQVQTKSYEWDVSTITHPSCARPISKGCWSRSTGASWARATSDRTRCSSRAWAEREAIAEIDVNPIMVRARGEGCVVVDALIVPRP
ncbi:MAG TPA: hypothetical protein VMR23_10360 [Candidatus Limnocylindria bacterium]|nr:hypothetical protein [Candidatus Limnocylindria bacterium]